MIGPMAVGTPVAAARAFLFVPGVRPDRFARAAGSGGHPVLDLEDAVAPAEKAAAREAVGTWLRDGNVAAVRVNARGTEWFEDDVRAVASHASAVVLPKTDCAEDVAAVHRAAGREVPVMPLIETPQGVLRAAEIAGARGVVRLALGHLDLAVTLGVDPRSQDALLLTRSTLVLASAAAGLPGPVDGVTPEVRDTTRVREDTAHARELGLTARLCIHPDQVVLVDEGLRPAPEEIAWALSVLGAIGDGGDAVAVVDGRMVDAPVVARARRVLAADDPVAPGGPHD